MSGPPDTQPNPALEERGIPASSHAPLTGTWHGEDVFEPRGLWGTTLVSERFVRLAERHATSHLIFVPIEKYIYEPSGHFYPRSTQTDPPSRG